MKLSKKIKKILMILAGTPTPGKKTWLLDDKKGIQ